MAKTKIDFKSLEIPAAAKTPLYAGVGAGDLAVTAVKEYVDDVRKALTGYQKDAQKTVTEFDARKLSATALEQAKARRAQVETRVAELQAEALALPTKVQSVVTDNVATVTDSVSGTYSDLAKRGEAVVRGTKLPSSASVEVKVNTTVPNAKKAPVRKPAVKRAPAAKKAPVKKAPAKKAPAKKTATPNS